MTNFFSSDLAVGFVFLFLFVLAMYVIRQLFSHNATGSLGGGHSLPANRNLHRVIASDVVYMREWLQKPQEVTFDPHNPEHQKALMMLHKYGRQHPTLRFAFDASKYESAYHSMIATVVETFVDKKATAAAQSLCAKMKQDAMLVDIDGRILRPRVVKKAKTSSSKQKQTKETSTTVVTAVALRPVFPVTTFSKPTPQDTTEMFGGWARLKH